MNECVWPVNLPNAMQFDVHPDWKISVSVAELNCIELGCIGMASLTSTFLSSIIECSLCPSSWTPQYLPPIDETIFGLENCGFRNKSLKMLEKPKMFYISRTIFPVKSSIRTNKIAQLPISHIKTFIPIVIGVNVFCLFSIYFV